MSLSSIRRLRQMQANDTRVSYIVTLTDSGKWMHAPGSDFLFAFVDDSWAAPVKDAVASAFESALGMSSIIKTAVKTTSGQDVVNGLYLLDQVAMTKAMNSIDGMGETTVDQKTETGEGTTVTINGQFFQAVLAGLGGDVTPMLTYLQQEMGDIQAQTKQSTVTETFGTVIGLISVMPVLNVVVTSFQYVYSSSQTAAWFVQLNTGSAQHYSYDYSFTVVNYNYVQPT
jgi:hypothetical protein